MFHLVKCVKNVPAYLAERLFESMKVSSIPFTRPPKTLFSAFMFSFAVVDDYTVMRSIERNVKPAGVEGGVVQRWLKCNSG